MKRTALSFIGRKFHSKKIKNYENKYLNIYNENWRYKPWEDYAKDCFKLQSETKVLILKSSGTQRMEYVFGLQALYNVREKELDYVEEKVLSLHISDYKHFFSSEYENIKSNIKGMEFNNVIKSYTDYGKIANSEKTKQNFMWNYVSACLAIYAIDKVFGDELSKIENNLRRR